LSETYSQSPELMAKEITIALIQKSSYASDKLLDYACESYDKVLKQLVESYREAHK